MGHEASLTDQILFWTAFGAIGQAVGAVATAAAVIVSLWVTLSDRTAKLDVSCGLRLTFAGDGTPAREIIAVKVANAGYRSVRISSIGWRTGWSARKFVPEWLRMQAAVQMFAADSPRPSYDLAPGLSVVFFIDVPEYQNPERRDRDVEFFCRKKPWRDAPTATRILCFVAPSVGKTHYVHVEPTLSAFFETGEWAKGA